MRDHHEHHNNIRLHNAIKCWRGWGKKIELAINLAHHKAHNEGNLWSRSRFFWLLKWAGPLIIAANTHTHAHTKTHMCHQLTCAHAASNISYSDGIICDNLPSDPHQCYMICQTEKNRLNREKVPVILLLTCRLAPCWGSVQLIELLICSLNEQSNFPNIRVSDVGL